MSAFTPHLNLELPGGGSLGIGGDDQVADIDVLNQDFQKIDTWAGEIESVSDPATHTKHFKGLATAIGSVPSPTLGDTYQETDGNKVFWRYDGANWLTNESGLYLIRPTSVATGTVVNADGSFTVTGVAESGLNGVFTPRFSRYKLFIRGVVTPNFRMRQGSVNAAGNYIGRRQYLSGANTNTNDIFGPNNEMPLIALTGTDNWLEVDFWDPAKSVNTVINGDTSAWTGGSCNSVTKTSGFHNVSTAYDGLGFLAGASMNFTGKLYAYA